jgi:hypothetical protein
MDVLETELMKLALERRYAVYRTHLKGLGVNHNAADYFEHILDDEEVTFDSADLPANEFCVDDTQAGVDISFADYIEWDPQNDKPTPKAA